MGLFINKNEHPNVYQPTQKLNEPNQVFSRQDFLTDLMQEQQKANKSLKQAMEDQMVKSLLAFHEKNAQLESILEKEAATKLSLMDQISELNKSYQEIASRMERNEEANQQLSVQMQEQLELQKETAEKMTKQEKLHGSVMERLDTQDALLDKIARQVNHIRSILFERTNYLAEKIDDGYKLTSSYVYKLMTGSEQPLTFFLLNHKKEEKQEEGSPQE